MYNTHDSFPINKQNVIPDYNKIRVETLLQNYMMYEPLLWLKLTHQICSGCNQQDVPLFLCICCEGQVLLAS